MRMEIQSRNRVSIKLRSSIERRLRFVLGRFAGRVSRVTVLLNELNGTDGKATKRCKIVIQFDTSAQVSVEDTDVDFQIAADRATGRVGQSVQHSLERALLVSPTSVRPLMSIGKPAFQAETRRRAYWPETDKKRRRRK
jgi:hypothetical protein